MHLGKASNDSGALAALCLLLTATLWGVAWYPLRLLAELGVNGIYSTLLVYGSASISFLWLLPQCKNSFVSDPWCFALLALCSGWANLAFILAVVEGQVLRAQLLFYLSPIWATLGAWLWLRERVSARAWATLAVAMVGALTLLWDPSLKTWLPRNVSDFLALSAGLAFAISNLCLRRLAHKNEHSKILASWFGVTLLSIGGLWVNTDPVPLLPLWQWLCAAVIGMGMVIVTSVCVVYGFSQLPVHRGAVIMLFEIFVGALSSMLLTQERMQANEWMGGLLIIFAAFLSTRQHVKQQEYNMQNT